MKAIHKIMEDIANQLTYNPTKLQNSIVLDGGKQKAILFAFSEGQELKEHKTNHDVLLIMLEGKCDFRMQEEQQYLEAGQVYRIPANACHSLKAATNFKMVLIK